MRKLIISVITTFVFCVGSGVCGGDTGNVDKAAALRESSRWQLEGAPQEVQAIGKILKEWFDAYLADEPGRARQTYLPSKRDGTERDLQQLKRLLEVAPGWQYQPMVIMAGGSEAKAVSGKMEISQPEASDAAILIVHLQRVEGQWGILYWSANALRAVPDFYPQFRRKYPDALIWFDETIDEWLKPDQKTGIDINIEDILTTSSANKTKKTLAQKLQESRGEQAIFESYFPDSVAGGKILDSWWEVKDKETYQDEDILTMTRNGLRRGKDGKPRRYKEHFIRWVGQQYIWPKEPKNKKAVELVYYASFDAELTGTAVYHGLSVAGDEQDSKVLKRLVDICMSYIYVTRILWGTKDKHERMVQYLEPYLNHADGQVRERAAILEKVFKGELDYDKWQQEQFRKQRQAEFGDKLPAIRQVLLKGNSRQRRDVFGLIKREGLGVLFDESFIEPLKACLSDGDPAVKEAAIVCGPDLFCKVGRDNWEMVQLMSVLSRDCDSKVRKAVAVFIGRCWIWEAKPQKPEAIEIMMRLSKDKDGDVRNATVYYGLSVVDNKGDEVIKRLIEMAVDTSGQENLGRIMWGLERGADKEKIRTYLKPYIGLRNKQGELARRVYFEIFKEELESDALIF
jgi:hypothetical protein